MKPLQQAGLQNRAEDWRHAFDQSFALAPALATAEPDDYLAIRTGASHPYALRLGEVAGLQALQVLTPFPSPHAALLGLASMRGEVLPVYDLRVLLGHPADSEHRPRWWVLAKDAPLGLAFETFERHLRLPPEAVASTEPGTDGGDARAHSVETLHWSDHWRPIVSIASLLQDIRALVSAQQDIPKENV